MSSPISTVSDSPMSRRGNPEVEIQSSVVSSVPESIQGATQSPERVDNYVESNPGAHSIEITQLGPSREAAQHDVIDYLGSLREWLEHDSRSRTQDLEAVVARIDQLDIRIDTLLPTTTTNTDVLPDRSGNGVTNSRPHIPATYHDIPIIPTLLPTARPDNEPDTRSDPLPTIPPQFSYTGYNSEPEASYRHVPPGSEQIPMPAPLPSTHASIEQLLHANQEQQQELLRYLRGLNQWLERDSADRRTDSQDLVARLDELRNEVNRINMRNETEVPVIPNTPEDERPLTPPFRRSPRPYPNTEETALSPLRSPPPEDEYTETRARRPRRRYAHTRRLQSDEDESSANSPTHIVIPPPERPSPPIIPAVYVGPQYQSGPTLVVPPRPHSEEPPYYSSMQEIDERVPPVSYATVNPFEASLRPRPSRSQSFRPSPYYTYPQTVPLPPVPPYMPGMPDPRHRRGSSYIVHPGPVYYDGPFIPPPPQDEEAFDCGFLCLPLSCQIASSSSIRGKIGIFLIAIYTFFIDTAPRQLYLHFLLRLPSLYFNRVSRIFEDAELILPDIKKMAIATADQWKGNEKGPAHMMMMSEQNYAMSPNLIDFKRSWETFVDSLMREWKTSNVVSVLLLSAILTMLQIDGAGTDPVPKYAALLSLICALMSLLYGCIYIIRFGSMKKMYKAASWAEEAQKTKTLLWWNVWVLLAMPAVWLAWSIILFITCILTYVWRSGSTTDASDPILLSPHAILGPRIAVTAVFALGVVYFLLIANTFGHYGESMDNAWRQKVVGWAKEGGGGRSYQNRTRTDPGPSSNYYDPRSQRPTNENQHYGRVYSPRPPSSTLPGPSSNYYDPRSQRPTNEIQHHGRVYSPRPPGSTLQQESPYVQRRRSLPRNLYAPSFQRPVDPTARHRPFGPEKLYNLTDLLDIRASHDVPSVLMEHDVNSDDWEFFISDIRSSYNRGSPNDIERTSEIIETWNKQFFVPRLVEISLCIEELDSSDTPNHALYMISPPSPFNEEHWVNTMDRGLLPHAVRRLVPYLDRHAPSMPPSPPPPRHSESSRVHFRTALSQE